jgi:transcriptional regulator with XRE-family HTH domain
VKQNVQDIAHHLRSSREARNLRQKDMLFRIGMTQQQYQNAESGKDIRLSTLLRILEGLDMSLVLVPNEKRKKLEEALAMPQESTGQTLLDAMKDLED